MVDFIDVMDDRLSREFNTKTSDGIFEFLNNILCHWVREPYYFIRMRVSDALFESDDSSETLAPTYVLYVGLTVKPTLWLNSLDLPGIDDPEFFDKLVGGLKYLIEKYGNKNEKIRNKKENGHVSGTCP